jgi:hypothetical protein
MDAVGADAMDAVGAVDTVGAFKAFFKKIDF